MKKLVLIIAVLAAAAFSANAQFRAELGVNFGKFSFDSQSLSAMPAPKVSAFYNFNFGESNGGLEVGLSFNQYRMQNLIEGNASNGNKMSISNLQIPLRATYTLRLGNKVNLTPCLGFYAGFAVGGKTTLIDGNTTDPFEGDGGLKRFDFGLDDEIYFTFSQKFVLGVGTQHSFLNRTKDSSIKTKSTGICISVGYIF